MFEKKKAFGKGISWIVLIAYERLLMYCKFATFMHGKGGVNFAELPQKYDFMADTLKIGHLNCVGPFTCKNLGELATWSCASHTVLQKKGGANEII